MQHIQFKISQMYVCKCDKCGFGTWEQAWKREVDLVVMR